MDSPQNTIRFNSKTLQDASREFKLYNTYILTYLILRFDRILTCLQSTHTYIHRGTHQHVNEPLRKLEIFNIEIACFEKYDDEVTYVAATVK